MRPHVGRVPGEGLGVSAGSRRVEFEAGALRRGDSTGLGPVQAGQGRVHLCHQGLKCGRYDRANQELFQVHDQGLDDLIGGGFDFGKKRVREAAREDPSDYVAADFGGQLYQGSYRRHLLGDHVISGDVESRRQDGTALGDLLDVPGAEPGPAVRHRVGRRGSVGVSDPGDLPRGVLVSRLNSGSELPGKSS